MATYYQGDRVIPGAGVYLEEQLKAKSAYEKALAQLKAQRARQQISSGLGSDWEVDPNAQYGSYQAMLQGQGSELMAANEQAQSRGFFGAGLGNQGESMLRYGHAVQNLGFKNQLADWENQYQYGMSEAARAKAEADRAAMQGAYESAYQNEDYTPYDPMGSNPTGTQYSVASHPGFQALKRSLFAGGAGKYVAGRSTGAPPMLAPAIRKARNAPVSGFVGKRRISGYQR